MLGCGVFSLCGRGKSPPAQLCARQRRVATRLLAARIRCYPLSGMLRHIGGIVVR